MSKQSQLLSEAIADAKAVKDTALANAKLALEEAFAPRIQSMLSTKLAEEFEEDEFEEEPEMGMSAEFDAPAPEEVAAPEMEAPVAEPAAEPEIEAPVAPEEPEMEMDDDLELEAIIRELEGEMEEPEMEEPAEEDPMYESNLDSLVKEIFEEEDNDDKSADDKSAEDETMDEVDAGTNGTDVALQEAYDTIHTMRSTLNEVNLLNAKLLYTNKLFRNFELSEGQKLKVLETFDRTNTAREVKLVFSTLAQSFKKPKVGRVSESTKRSSASEIVGNTTPTKHILEEGNALKTRFMELAKLKTNNNING